MSGTLNKIMLIGHLGDEVKMKYFDNGGIIGRFPLATNESYVNRTTGERVSNTEWHNCVVRNKAAEVCEKYLSKGDRIYVEGRVKTRSWMDENGSKRYQTEVQVTEFTFLSTKKDTYQTRNNPIPEHLEQTQNGSDDAGSDAGKSQTQHVDTTLSEDDLPF